eukprot:Skav235811  [mRNA]  locus=scaffold1267:329833:334624:- [translate_table: standard]
MDGWMFLRGIRGKLQDALAIQGEQGGDPEELGNQARRLRLASVIRSELETKRRDWAAQHPAEFEALKVNPKSLPSNIRSQGQREKQSNCFVVPSFTEEGSQELQETFQQILQTEQLTDAALLLEAAVDQELQRMRTVRKLLQKPQIEIISRYGFPSSEKGIEEMEAALQSLEDDGDIYVLCLDFRVIQGEAWFQEAILKLQHKKDSRDRGERGKPDPDGYFHLPGRAEVALEVQQKILPRFGFDATKAVRIRWPLVLWLADVDGVWLVGAYCRACCLPILHRAV